MTDAWTELISDSSNDDADADDADDIDDADDDDKVRSTFLKWMSK